jgi:hypothetical protein
MLHPIIWFLINVVVETAVRHLYVVIGDADTFLSLDSISIPAKYEACLISVHSTCQTTLVWIDNLTANFSNIIRIGFII